MGKGWKFGKQRGGGGGHYANNDMSLQSCRGYSVVLCSCDVAREREASKELVNLLSQAVDVLYPFEIKNSADEEAIPSNSKELSIQELLQLEIQQVQKKSNKQTQRIVSINTDMKGLVLAKILMKNVCVIRIVEEVFQRIEREKKPYCKNIVRMIPLAYTFYPRDDEFLETCYIAMTKQYDVDLPQAKQMIFENKSRKSLSTETTSNPSEEANSNEEKKVDPVEVEVNDSSIPEVVLNDRPLDFEEPPSKRPKLENNSEIVLAIENPLPPSDIHNQSHVSSTLPGMKHHIPFTCEILFKARNHNILTKRQVMDTIHLCLPSSLGRLSFVDAQVHVVVEAIKNLGGMSILCNYKKYLEYNLRKFQAACVTHDNSSSRVSALSGFKKVSDCIGDDPGKEEDEAVCDEDVSEL